MMAEIPYEEQIKKLCTDVEQMTSVENFFVLEKINNVLMTEREGQAIIIEMKPDDCFSMCIQRR